ncbi:DUF4190 domain-containing protein [Amycolatopsis sp. CA-126428]|uniref:DUF4190 domain-containing protein n=1 Tax=Amycolatopsis sp. CA-126428 TaxID=2073158 RepID=UPI000CD0575F|nr:DUF4190 domain-containing protein [Amycolatopsis sp. CA-126428]
MTDPSGDKDRPAADPTVAYDPPAADPAPYEPESYDPPSSDATIAAATPDTGDTTAAGTSTTEAPDATVAAEQPGQLPPGAYETPAAYIPGTPFAAPGEPQPMYQPAYQQQTYQQPYPPGYGRPYAPPAPFGQPYPGQPHAQDNALAIGALVCSILGFCSGITALAGLVMGHIALSRTNRGEAGGRGLATAAVIVGYVVIALWVGFFTTLIILGTNGDLS